LSDETRFDVKQLLEDGDKAGAIEAYQAATGATLAEALDYIETEEKHRR